MPSTPLKLWIGPLIALAGLLSYFTYFVRFPSFRDSAWLNLVLVGLGLGLSILALGQRGGEGFGKGSKGLAWGALLVSGLSAGLLFLYVFGLSKQMPDVSDRTLALARVPALTLQDQQAQDYALGTPTDKGRIITFYRGHW